MKPEKVALMTCFLDNCGACLQAFALQQTIEKLGCKCDMIRFTEPNGYRRASLLNSSRLIDKLKCVRSKEFKRQYDAGLYKISAFNIFRKKYLKLTKEEYKTYDSLSAISNGYPAFVCGSDQIWNPTFYKKCNPAYYLAFVPDGIKKIAYAPSIGLNDIPEEYRASFQKYVERFDSLSVREKRGAELISAYTGRTAEFVLDPTLLLSTAEWKRLVKAPAKKRPYIFCYLFGRHEYYREVIDRMISKTGYDAVMYPIFREDGDAPYEKVINGGPQEFISLISEAEYVLTDSFHATVFSLIFNRSFYTLIRDSDNDKNSMNSRIYSLLECVGKTDRLLAKEDALTVEPVPVSDFSGANQTIAALKESSIQYLKKALEE